jgi:type II restriction enzyme
MELEPLRISKSMGLSKRLIQMNSDGRKLNVDSISSESTLGDAMIDIIAYAKEKIATIGGTIAHKKQISLYECQQYFHKVGGPTPNNMNNQYMKPDGGIIFATINHMEYPIMIVEDKVQGTNDTLHEEGKKRQATGNAVERAGKNIRGAEMIFSEMNIFPYILFASGCDFHHTETISKRIEMMNMGFPNHYIEVTPQKSEIMLENMLSSIHIHKCCGRSIASVFIKAHKWDEMSHGSSRWKKEEIIKIGYKVIDLVVDELIKKQDT